MMILRRLCGELLNIVCVNGHLVIHSSLSLLELFKDLPNKLPEQRAAFYSQVKRWKMDYSMSPQEKINKEHPRDIFNVSSLLSEKDNNEILELITKQILLGTGKISNENLLLFLREHFSAKDDHELSGYPFSQGWMQRFISKYYINKRSEVKMRKEVPKAIVINDDILVEFMTEIGLEKVRSLENDLGFKLFQGGNGSDSVQPYGDFYVRYNKQNNAKIARSESKHNDRLTKRTAKLLLKPETAKKPKTTAHNLHVKNVTTKKHKVVCCSVDVDVRSTSPDPEFMSCLFEVNFLFVDDNNYL